MTLHGVTRADLTTSIHIWADPQFDQIQSRSNIPAG